ncbi:MAG: alpha/beta fold hydrolase [Oceanospirillaceae bacterium]|nr:alpha/beta fold hydrolase [Oceanospirillaceae bacterium]
MRATLIGLLLMMLAGCAPHQQYRPNYDLCRLPADIQTQQCAEHARQVVEPSSDAGYSLNFIEFDDQGSLWDRAQMGAVLDALSADSVQGDLLIVVFVHGWKHSAASGDPNIDTFRRVLAQLSENEAYMAGLTGLPPRRVAGVYLGWRGGSVPVPLLEDLTFWNRKNTAQKVGHGDVTEVLSRLEKLKRDRGSIDGNYGAVRLVVVGHSFGGLVVHTALAQILANRFVVTTGPDGVQGNIENFGDLVVLINPAFEAQLYASLHDISTERGSYFESQLPVLAILTSEADDATGTAFPLGRRVSTLFEKTRTVERWNAAAQQQEMIDEGAANVTAVGHFEPYRTHRLYPAPGNTRHEPLSTRDSLEAALVAARAWRDDAPGSRIPFASLLLEREADSAARNPYLVMRVDRDIIPDHNNIEDPRVIEFVTQLIMISTVPEARRGRLDRAVGN